MKTAKHDRRSERTHQMLSTALVDLLQERRYADLTVQDILDRANIGRTTFYTHYWDKDDLLASAMERVIDVPYSHISTSTGDCALQLPSLEMFHCIEASAKLIRALVRGQAMELLWSTLQTRLCERFTQHLRFALLPPIDELAVRVITQFVIGTFITLVQWWVEDEMPFSAKELDAYFQQLTLPGVRAVLQLKD